MKSSGARENARIVIVSKPLGPPWNDSGKNLPRDIVTHLPGERFRVFVPKGTRLSLANADEEELHPTAGAYAPGLSQNARLFVRLLRPDPDAEMYHFFFTPNPLSCRFARIVIGLKKAPCIQNVSSYPGPCRDVRKLMFGDRVVVHSDHTKARLEVMGIKNVVRIYPGITIPREPSHSSVLQARTAAGGGAGPLILYPGDYRFSGAVPTLASAIAAVHASRPDARFALACRIKTPSDRECERGLIARLEKSGARGAVSIMNDVPDFYSLIAASDLVIFPVTSLYAKMDIPLALIECLALGKPLILSGVGPLREILKRPAGMLIPPESPEALAQAILQLSRDERQRRAMGEEGPRVALEHYDMRKIARAYAELYKELRDETTR